MTCKGEKSLHGNQNASASSGFLKIAIQTVGGVKQPNPIQDRAVARVRFRKMEESSAVVKCPSPSEAS